MPTPVSMDAGMMAARLQRIAFFACWTAAEIEAICAAAETRLYKKGERIYEAGHANQPGLFVIASGTVRIHHDWPDGRHMLQAVYFPGQLLQLSSFADGVAEPFSCSARSDARLIFIPRRPLIALLQDDPAKVFALAAQLSARSRVDYMAMKLKVRGSHRSHLAAALWYYARGAARYAAPHSAAAQGGITHDLTQDELAAMLGIARQTVNRLMRQMTHDGIIAREGRETRVLDFDRLLAIVEEDGPMPDVVRNDYLDIHMRSELMEAGEVSSRPAGEYGAESAC